MKKELYYKILSTFVIISLLLLNIAPFSIKADYFGGSPYIGLNIWIEDYDNEYNLSLNSTTGTFTQTSGSITMAPFNVNGQTYYSSAQGLGQMNQSGTITLNQSGSSSQVVRRVIHCDIILDNNYVGYIKVRVHANGNTYFNQQLAVNSNTVSFQYVDNSSSTNLPSYNVSFDEQLLIKNNSNERWEFPIESYPLVLSAFNNNLKLVGINEYNSYYLPIFELKNGDTIHSSYATPAYTNRLIMITSDNVSEPNISNFFQLNDGEFINYRYISQFLYGSTTGRIFSVDITNYSRSGGKSIKYIGSNNMKYIPIYFNTAENKFISTDFALNFGLTNAMLDNLNIIANGTQQSNDSSTQADTTNQAAEQIFSQEEQLVNNAENDLKYKLTNLDIQNQNNNLFGNSKFISSALWVKTQFDNLTNNNAFGYLITFSLVIGLSLVIIGKLRG